MSTDNKKPQKARLTKDPVGTGSNGSPSEASGSTHSERVNQTLRVANTIHMLTMFFPASTVSCGALIGGCELALGRKLDQTLDRDLEDAITALVDLCFDKRDVLREDATSVAKQPKGVM